MVKPTRASGEEVAPSHMLVTNFFEELRPIAKTGERCGGGEGYQENRARGQPYKRIAGTARIFDFLRHNFG